MNTLPIYLTEPESLKLEKYQGNQRIYVLPIFEGDDLLDGGILIYDLYKDDTGVFLWYVNGVQGPDMDPTGKNRPGYLGRILFDREGYWIYDGNRLSVEDSEIVAQFISSFDQDFSTY